MEVNDSDGPFPTPNPFATLLFTGPQRRQFQDGIPRGNNNSPLPVVHSMNHFVIALLACHLLAMVTANTRAQTLWTMSGMVKSSETGEALIGANIIVADMKNVGASSNAYGFYSLTIPAGRHTLFIQYLGFKTSVDSLNLDRDLTIDFELSAEPIKVQEVVVSGERSNANVTSTEMSSKKLEVREVKSIPVLLGEKDILKTIQLFPGIKSAGE